MTSVFARTYLEDLVCEIRMILSCWFVKISSTRLSEFHELCNLNFTNSTIEVCCFAEALILTDQHIWISWTLFSHELVIWKSSTQSCGFHRLNHLKIIKNYENFTNSTIYVCCVAESLILTNQYTWILWTIFSHELVFWISRTLLFKYAALQSHVTRTHESRHTH